VASLKVVVVAGARPNFMKVAPILKVLETRSECFPPVLVHTGQHYDHEMSATFFRDLALQEPHHYLGIGSGTHAEQVARAMLALEPVLEAERPEWVVVVGDVNSTVAAAFTAVKMGIPTAHIEAGLRSYDRRMPEELNRVATDSICDLLLTPSEDADANLRREGIPAERIVRVGNVMIDSIVAHLPAARALRAWEGEGCGERRYVLITLHRPSNVDAIEKLTQIIDALCEVARDIPVLFPAHPRTAERLELIRGHHRSKRLRIVRPMGYLAFLSVLSGARVVLTDSGGVQEESSFLGIPCLTFRENTERPVTIERGTSRLIGTDARRIVPSIQESLQQELTGPRPIPLWDGHAADRIVASLLRARDDFKRGM